MIIQIFFFKLQLIRIIDAKSSYFNIDIDFDTYTVIIIDLQIFWRRRYFLNSIKISHYDLS